MSDFGDIDCYGYRNILPTSPTNSYPAGTPTHSKVILDRDQAIEEVRKLISSKENSSIKRTDDEFILRFLRARKMNIEDSYQLMCNYYSYREKNPELFDGMTLDDPLIKQALYDGFPGVLSSRDRKGRCLLVFFCSNWDQVNYPLEVIYRALLLSLERLINDPQNQANGFVIIVDWTDMSLRQVMSLTPKILKLMVEGLQDCFPARFKGVHFLNQPWYIDPCISVLKAFLKEKTKKKIFIHGNNLSTLHNHVSVDVLPTELGGEGPPYNPTDWADAMTTQSLSDPPSFPKS